MQVYGPSYIHAPHSVEAPHTHRPSQNVDAANSPGAICDELQISEAGRLADRMSEIPDIRWDKVNSIREALAEGAYETNEKLSIALDRLLDEIG